MSGIRVDSETGRVHDFLSADAGHGAGAGGRRRRPSTCSFGICWSWESLCLYGIRDCGPACGAFRLVLGMMLGRRRPSTSSFWYDVCAGLVLCSLLVLGELGVVLVRFAPQHTTPNK